MRTFTRPLIIVIATCAIAAAGAAQGPPLTTGLQLPSKMILTPRGHLLVAENGTGPNAGRISRVDRITGARRTLIAGLPAGINAAEGQPAPSGPSGLFLSGNTLYVTIGQGDAVAAGPAPGTQAPNASPASPLLTSLLTFTFDGSIDDVAGDLALTPADHTALDAGEAVVAGSEGNRLTAKLVADFENHRAEPRGDFQANVRASNPYGVVVRGDFAYVVDAGWNSVRKVNRVTGETTSLAQFAAVANPTPVGGPFTDAVPDSIRLDGDRLLVTLLTGFPFASGIAKVLAVDPDAGAVSTVIEGLTSAIDVVALDSASGKQYVVSEFSTNLLQGAPGRITLVRPGSESATLVASIVSPASLAVDARTGEIFVAQIFPGIITRHDASSTLPPATPSAIIPVAGSVAGAFGSRFETSLQLSNPHAYAISGALVFRGATTGSMAYALGAHETKSFANLMSAAGVSGIATVDIEAGVGGPPVAIARLFDTSVSSASTGTVIEQVDPSEALGSGESGAIVAAADPSTSRTNVGVRALGAGATATLSLYRAGGTLAATIERSFAPNELFQQSAGDLFDVAPAADDSIVIEVRSGTAILYASIVNNVTQETSWHHAR